MTHKEWWDSVLSWLALSYCRRDWCARHTCQQFPHQISYTSITQGGGRAQQGSHLLGRVCVCERQCCFTFLQDEVVEGGCLYVLLMLYFRLNKQNVNSRGLWPEVVRTVMRRESQAVHESNAAGLFLFTSLYVAGQVVFNFEKGKGVLCIFWIIPHGEQSTIVMLKLNYWRRHPIPPEL